jgi:hypothetical protein
MLLSFVELSVAGSDGAGGDDQRRSASRMTSAMVWGCVAGHSFRMIAGKARHKANRIAPVPIDTLAPRAMPAKTTNAIVANQTWITLDRVMSVTMALN